jgi:multidrug resistance efflux pump
MTEHLKLLALADAYHMVPLYSNAEKARAALSDALLKVVQDAQRYRALRDSGYMPAEEFTKQCDAAMQEKP